MNSLQSTMNHAHKLSKWHPQIKFAVVVDPQVKYTVKDAAELSEKEKVIYTYNNGIRTFQVERT